MFASHAPVFRDGLENLAAAYGIAHEYLDYKDDLCTVSDATLQAVLAAFGVEPTSNDHAHELAAHRRDQVWHVAVPPTLVWTRGSGGHLPIVTDEGQVPRVHLVTESGETRELTEIVGTEPHPLGDVTRVMHFFAHPEDVPDGYHQLNVDVGGATTTATLLSVPGALPRHPSADRQRSGMCTQLYSVVSESSWGVGDFADLVELSKWAKDSADADFVLINPVHAAHPTTHQEPSPYLPTSRRFYNPMYLRVEHIDEFGSAPAALVERASQLRAECQDALRGSSRIDRDKTWAAKNEVLRAVFALPRSAEREEAFARFRAERGETLEHFALWCALAVHFEGQEWPPSAAGPDAEGIGEWVSTLADEITYFCWLQWVTEAQLAASKQAAADHGLAIGVIHDLAVGVHPSGADAWALADSLARGVTVGAPPDGFNQQGQDWSQPPWRPSGLAETGYRAVRDVVAASLRHAGGVRIDHVMGMFRLWWVPAGQPASEGTYVYYDEQAMLGIICLEAARAGAVVVGEDLGTVEPRVGEQLGSRGFLGTNILWWEQNSGGLIDPSQWREQCFATVTTHDLPPTPSYLDIGHVALRESLGLLVRDPAEEYQAAKQEVNVVLDGLRAHGLLHDGASEEDTIVALHQFLTRTPSRLVGWSLTDAVGERRTQNQPGTCDEYPNWRIPLGTPDGKLLTIEDLRGNERALRFAASMKNH